MKAAIVTIGDEILIGQIVDTNSSYIAKALDKIGIATHEMLSISDDKKHILTGGLGPTKDDITKKTFCDYFEDNLIENEEVLFHVKSIIEGIYKRPITQINRDQALVPTKAKVLFNKVGTAPGIWMEKENTVFISLPGVPYEMKYLVDNEVIPNLVQKFERPYIVHQTIMTYGRGESMIAEQIEEWEDNLPEFIKLAYLPSPGKVRLLRNEINNQVQKLDLLIHDIIVGYNEDEPIEVVLGRLLTDKNLTIATAESCTGGKIAATLSAVPGASNYFKGSVVSYATQAKTNVLGVANELIIEHGVVSAEVAVEMAKSVQKIMASDFAIATTGNACPTKGDDIAEL
uniref:nicotinamide-nucleotide amidohydrolase family protein n=1 Tax=Flavobacterium sp. TaxID=239 RepID=UPI00404796F1